MKKRFKGVSALIGVLTLSYAVPVLLLWALALNAYLSVWFLFSHHSNLLLSVCILLFTVAFVSGKMARRMLKKSGMTQEELDGIMKEAPADPALDISAGANQTEKRIMTSFAVLAAILTILFSVWIGGVLAEILFRGIWALLKVLGSSSDIGFSDILLDSFTFTGGWKAVNIMCWPMLFVEIMAYLWVAPLKNGIDEFAGLRISNGKVENEKRKR